MTAMDLGLLIMRLVLGLTFMAHGSQKLFGWFGGTGMKGHADNVSKLGVAHPVPLAWMSGLTEFFGGLFMFFGLLTPLAAAVIVSSMLVAIQHIHRKNGFFTANRGYEFPLNIIAICVALMLMGAGLVSLDHLLGFAVSLDQMPRWFIVLVVIVPFAGMILIDWSRRAKETPVTGQVQS